MSYLVTIIYLETAPNINGNFYDFTNTFWLEAASSKENVTELLKLYLKPLGGKKVVSSETVPGRKAEADGISVCKEGLDLYPVSSQSVENKEENLGSELGDNPAPVNAVVQKKKNVLVRRKGEKEENNSTQTVLTQENRAEPYQADDRKMYRSYGDYPVDMQGFAG